MDDYSDDPAMRGLLTKLELQKKADELSRSRAGAQDGVAGGGAVACYVASLPWVSVNISPRVASIFS
jgi:hypothetical protein